MGAEQGGDHVYGHLQRHPLDQAEHPQLVFEVEAVPGLDLDGRRPVPCEPADAALRRLEQLGVRGSARGSNGRRDAATGGRDLLVRDTGQTLLELVRPVAAEQQVGVGVDQTRRHQTTTHRVHGSCVRGVGRAAHEDDGAVLDRDRRTGHDAVALGGRVHRGDVEVDEEDVSHHDIGTSIALNAARSSAIASMSRWAEPRTTWLPPTTTSVTSPACAAKTSGATP